MTTAAVGCGEPYDLRVAFDPPALADDASRIDLAVVPSCGAQTLGEDAGGALAMSVLTRDADAMALGALPPGTYGLYGRAVGDDCDIVAAGCIPIQIEAGGSGTLTVVLDRFSGTTCPVGQCSEGVCVPGGDAGQMDGGPFDAGPVDAGDAGAPDGGCGVDCDDTNPCTDDTCVAGVCTNTTRDADDDGHGDATCPEAGGVPNDDCDDTDPLIGPSLPERCNGADDDCDEATDEEFECVLGGTEACPACGPGQRVCEDSCTFGACVPTTDADTVALWAFEEAGPDFADTTGTHDGTTLVGSSARVDGPRFCGQAFDVDGTGYGVVPNSTDFDLDVGSISMWVRFDREGPQEGVLSRDESGVDTPGHFTVRRLVDSTLEARIQTTGLTYSCVTATPVASGVWHELVVRFGPPDYEMVLDGVVVPGCVGDAAAPWTTGIGGNTNPFSVGANSQLTEPGVATDATDLLDGAIDHVEIRSGRADAVSPEIVSIVLVDADTEADIGPLSDGAVLDLASLPPNLNFRVTVDPARPGSALLVLDGVAGATQDDAPYSYRDNAGDYTPVEVTPGAHVLTATAYTSAQLMGTEGPTVTINFTAR